MSAQKPESLGRKRSNTLQPHRRGDTAATPFISSSSSQEMYGDEAIWPGWRCNMHLECIAADSTPTMRIESRSKDRLVFKDCAQFCSRSLA